MIGRRASKTPHMGQVISRAAWIHTNAATARLAKTDLIQPQRRQERASRAHIMRYGKLRFRKPSSTEAMLAKSTSPNTMPARISILRLLRHIKILNPSFVNV
jgi:hypothetical protein